MTILASASTDSSLVRRVQACEIEAWSSFVHVYGPLIYVWCRRRGLPREDAADITQDVFVAAARSIATFKHDSCGSLRGWLWTITRNKLHDFRRSRETQAAGGSEFLQRLKELPAELPEDSDDRGDSHQLLHRALEQVRAEFAPTTWRAFTLTVLESWDNRRAAAELGTTPNNIRQCKSRVLRRLRQQLNLAGDDSPQS